MTNEYMDNIQPSIREMQVETALKFHLMAIRLAAIQKTNGKTGMDVHCWWACKLLQSEWKSAGRFLRKTKSRHTTLLFHLPKRLHILYQRDTCTSMVIASLFMVAKSWNQPRQSLVGGQIKKKWYICTINFCSHKINEVIPFSGSEFDQI